MSTKIGFDPKPPLSADAERAEQLLRVYPDVDAAEVDEIARFLRKGPFLEVHRLTSSEELAVKVAAFKAAHPSRFELSLKEYLWVVLVVLGPLLIFCWLVWDSGKN
ncbi:hypothetical protein [Allosphingosinicella humi]|jgi:hypothetical protein